MVHVEYYNESFVKVNCSADIAFKISKQFEFYAPNYIWSPKYRAGLWDGKIRLFNLDTCLLPQGLCTKLVKYLKNTDQKFIVDEDIKVRGYKLSEKEFDSFSKSIKSKFKARDYQSKAVRMMLYYRKMVALSPTSSGKSYIAYMFFNYLRYKDEESKFLLVVPTTSLVEQMAKDFQEYAENWCDYSQYVHKIYAGCEKWTDKPITISTWQSLQKMPTKYFKQFDAIIADECHTATSKVLTGIIEKGEDAYFKVGMSGTIKDAKIDTLQLQGLFGPVCKLATTKQLMTRGYISKLKIHGIVLDYDKMMCKQAKKIGDYATEVAMVNSYGLKRRYVCGLAGSRKKNTLVLFRLTEYGKALKHILENYTNKKVFYIDGSVKTKYREDARAYCEDHDDAIIVASYGTFSTGINIKNLHYIVFAESMKSPIKVLQSVGRLLRLHKSKKIAVLYDVADNLSVGKKLNYLLKHFLKRAEYYENEGFNYTVKHVKLKGKI